MSLWLEADHSFLIRLLLSISQWLHCCISSLKIVFSLHQSGGEGRGGRGGEGRGGEGRGGEGRGEEGRGGEGRGGEGRGGEGREGRGGEGREETKKRAGANGKRSN